MIRLGKKICERCNQEREILYDYEGKALCLACIKEQTIYTCDYCGAKVSKLFWHDADLLCADCLKKFLKE